MFVVTNVNEWVDEASFEVNLLMKKRTIKTEDKKILKVKNRFAFNTRNVVTFHRYYF